MGPVFRAKPRMTLAKRLCNLVSIDSAPSANLIRSLGVPIQFGPAQCRERPSNLFPEGASPSRFTCLPLPQGEASTSLAPFHKGPRFRPPGSNRRVGAEARPGSNLGGPLLFLNRCNRAGYMIRVHFMHNAFFGTTENVTSDETFNNQVSVEDSHCGRAAPHLLQSSSSTRFAAGAAGFLVLIQQSLRPDRYGVPRRFETMPSHPSAHACS
jgi:hypothetical protein